MTISSNPPLNTNQLPISLDVNPEDKDFDNILLLYLRRVANAVNTKENGLFFCKKPLTLSNGIKLEILNKTETAIGSRPI